MGAPMPASIRAALNRPKPDDWQIACPGCGAKPGTPCHRPRGGPVAGGSHPSRADAWLIQRHAA